MSAVTAPGVYVEFVDPPSGLDPVAVDVPAFVGVFERGPLDTPTRVASWPQCQSQFGDFVLNGVGAYALKGWVDNGGRAAYVVRVAAPRRATQTSAAAQPADRGSSILDALDGFVLGAAAAVQQGSGTWVYLVTGVDPTTNRVTWDRRLHPDINIAAGFTVVTGASAGAVTLADAAGTAVLEISAASAGAWGNHVTVLAEPSFAAATTALASTSKAASPVEHVDGFTAPTLARLTQEIGGALVSEQRLITAIDAGSPTFTWDSPLATIAPTVPFRIEAQTFSLSVRERGVLQEAYSELSIVPGSRRYAPQVLAGSALIAVTTAGTSAPPGTGNPASHGWVRLAGGLDGTAALSLLDLLGDEQAGVNRGLASLANVEEPAILAAPDLVAEPVAARISVPPEVTVDPCLPCPPPPPPPALLVADVIEASASFTPAQIASAQQALIDDCEARGDRIALLDPPCGERALDVPALISWRARLDSSYAALHAPWLQVLDPLASTPGQPPTPWGDLRRLPPSGHVAGLLAQVDADTGPWHAPANRMLSWVHQADMVLDDAGHGRLNAAGIDALRALKSRGVAVLGARTVSSDPSWLFLGTRRLFLMLERTFRVGLAWTAFEPAGPRLEKLMASVIGGLLSDLFDRGAFGGSSPQTSFFVQTGGGDPLIGEVIVEIGIVPAPPAEVILLQVVRTANQLELREQPKRSA